MTTAALSSTTTAAAATNTVNNGLASVANNYQTFLSLLTTQLKNQDPLSPLDTNQFTQQLTQMTGVEQQLLSNQLLQQLVNQNQGGGLTGAVGLIGKTVTRRRLKATLQSGAGSSAVRRGHPARQPDGQRLRRQRHPGVERGLTPNGSGLQSFTWNGKNQSGAQQPDGGNYTLSVTATDSAGANIPVATSFQGTATAVQEVNGQTMVTVGGSQVPLSSVTGVT